MENIFSGVNMGDILDQATIFLSAFSPYVAFIVGLLLAFFVLNFIVSTLKGGASPQSSEKEEDFDEDYI
jgi:hypothetical protein